MRYGQRHPRRYHVRFLGPSGQAQDAPEPARPVRVAIFLCQRGSAWHRKVREQCSGQVPEEVIEVAASLPPQREGGMPLADGRAVLRSAGAALGIATAALRLCLRCLPAAGLGFVAASGAALAALLDSSTATCILCAALHVLAIMLILRCSSRES